MAGPIITINVTTYDSLYVNGGSSEITMIPFSAVASGQYFSGRTIADGFDTQTKTPDSFALSARYMLEGTDFEGNSCRLFIENNGSSLENCTPKIVTDSKALAFLNSCSLRAEGECTDKGVIIRIYER